MHAPAVRPYRRTRLSLSICPQAGTPRLAVTTHHDAAAQTFSLTFKQTTAPSPGQDSKLPVLIPIRMGLLGPDGEASQHTSPRWPVGHGAPAPGRQHLFGQHKGCELMQMPRRHKLHGRMLVQRVRGRPAGVACPGMRCASPPLRH